MPFLRAKDLSMLAAMAAVALLAAAESRLVARLCGLNIEDMNRVDYGDYLKLQAVLLRFLRGDDDAAA